MIVSFCGRKVRLSGKFQIPRREWHDGLLPRWKWDWWRDVALRLNEIAMMTVTYWRCLLGRQFNYRRGCCVSHSAGVVLAWVLGSKVVNYDRCDGLGVIKFRSFFSLRICLIISMLFFTSESCLRSEINSSISHLFPLSNWLLHLDLNIDLRTHMNVAEIK